MSHARLVLATFLSAILLVGAGAGCGGAAAAGGACQPVNNWGGPIFACGGGGGSLDEQPKDDNEGGTETTDNNTTDTTPDADTTQEEPPAPEPAVSVDGDTIATRDAIEFEDGKATLTSESQATLDAVAQYLKDNPDIAVVNVGVHPDSKDKKAAKLAKKRATEVRKHLTKQGIAGKRLKAKGLKEPADSNLVVLEVAKRK